MADVLLDSCSMGKDLGSILRAHHVQLDILFERLLEQAHLDDADALQRTWTQFERQLLAHADFEDEKLVPQLRQIDPEAAETIAAEHAQIRALVARMGLGIELHVVREREAEELIALLRSHAARESRTLYDVADRLLPDDVRLAITLELRKLWDGTRRVLSREKRVAGAPVIRGR